jgi:hypothetical protein
VQDRGSLRDGIEANMNQRCHFLLVALVAPALWLALPDKSFAQYIPRYGSHYRGGFPGGFGGGFPGGAGGYGGVGVGGLNPPGVSINQGYNVLPGMPSQIGMLGGGFGGFPNYGLGGYGFPNYGYPAFGGFPAFGGGFPAFGGFPNKFAGFGNGFGNGNYGL